MDTNFEHCNNSGDTALPGGLCRRMEYWKSRATFDKHPIFRKNFVYLILYLVYKQRAKMFFSSIKENDGRI